MDGRRRAYPHIYPHSAAVLRRCYSYGHGILAYMALERLFSLVNVPDRRISACGMAHNDAEAAADNGLFVGTQPPRNDGGINGGLSCFHTADAYNLYIRSAVVYRKHRPCRYYGLIKP